MGIFDGFFPQPNVQSVSYQNGIATQLRAGKNGYIRNQA